MFKELFVVLKAQFSEKALKSLRKHKKPLNKLKAI
jgi:hypothetical protein